MVEVWIEDLCYALTLWWEVRPVLKVGSAGLRGLKNDAVVEVGGEACARVKRRVMEMEDVARIETLQQLVDGTRGQSSGSGRPVEPRLGRLNERGPTEVLRITDLNFRPSGPDPNAIEVGSSRGGSSGLLGDGSHAVGLVQREDVERAKPFLQPVESGLVLGPSREACLLGWSGPRLMKGPDAGISSFWLKSKEELEDPSPTVRPNTDGALMEEA